jgi:hypothetical protein
MFYILGRLEAFNLPDDKVGIIEYLEKVEAKLEVRFFVEQVTEEFRQGRGTSILVRHLKDGMKGVWMHKAFIIENSSSLTYLCFVQIRRSWKLLYLSWVSC